MIYAFLFIASVATIVLCGIGAELVKLNRGLARLADETNKLSVLYYAANRKEIADVEPTPLP